MIEVYKIFKGIDEVDFNQMFTRNVDGRTRGHEFKLFKNLCRMHVRQKFFSNRVVSCWNELSAEVVSNK